MALRETERVVIGELVSLTWKCLVKEQHEDLENCFARRLKRARSYFESMANAMVVQVAYQEF